MTSDYTIRLEPIGRTLEALDVQQLIDEATEQWYNQTLFQVGDVLLRLGVFEPGAFHWHRHDGQDELFFVLDGRVRIELNDPDDPATATLGPRESFVVPRGVLHRPVALERSAVLMLEQAGVVPTGDPSA